jgi:stage V sporulation protein B
MINESVCGNERDGWEKDLVSRAAEMAQVSAKGGFNLFWGLAASTIVSAVGVILTARLLSQPEFGVVAIALMAPTLISLFRDWGVNSAITRYTAQYAAEDKTANIKRVFAAGLLFELALGVLLSLASFLLSGFLATSVFHRPDIEPLIQVASLTVVGGAFLTAAQSAFIGQERMELNSVTLIIQSVLKTVLAPLLIILGFGAFGAILGSTIAVLAAGLVSIVIFYLAIYRKLQRLKDEKLEVARTVKTMFKYGLPLSLSAILGGFLAQFFNFLMAIYCTDLLIGNYQVAVNFAVLITFFATPIATVMFPAFSKLNPQEEKEAVRYVFQFSVKYAALLVVPATAIIMALSQPVVSTIFGEKYIDAPLFLTLYSIIYLYSAFGSLSLGNLLNGIGKTDVNLKLTIITFAVGLPLSLLLIPKLGIIGLIATTLIAGIPSLFTGLWWIRKRLTVTVDWASSAKILLASAIAAAATYTVTSQLPTPDWAKLIIGTAMFLTICVTATPLIGAINKTDVYNLRAMLKELGPLSNIFDLPLNTIEKLAPNLREKPPSQH